MLVNYSTDNVKLVQWAESAVNIQNTARRVFLASLVVSAASAVLNDNLALPITFTVVCCVSWMGARFVSTQLNGIAPQFHGPVSLNERR